MIKITFAIVVVFGLGNCKAMALEPGHSAMWFNPDRSGEGLVVEVLSSDHVLLYWFTYDDEGNQRWLQGVGVLSAADDEPQRIEFSEFYLTRGPTFGPSFDPDDLEIIPVGSASLAFQNCESGTFSFNVNGETGQIPVVRLSRTMGSTCRPLHGVPGEPTKVYAGESGSWFDPTSSGQGFSLQWLTRDEALITWYTYDSQGNQYWLVGNGRRDGSDIYFEMLHATTGARFGEAFDPDDVELIDWGSLRLSLSCGSGTAEYESELAEFGSGTLNLARLTAIDGLPCPWARPAIDDLYEIDIEVVIDSRQLPSRRIVVRDFAQDQTILGWAFTDSSAWLRVRGNTEFQLLSNDDHILTPVISADGATIYAEQLNRDTNQSRIVTWTSTTGWELIEGVLANKPTFVAVSHSRESILGADSQADTLEEFFWVWNETSGFSFVDFRSADERLIPLAVSNDGKRFAAVQQAPAPGDKSPSTFWIENDSITEILWGNSQESLSSSQVVCDADCRTVFGIPTNLSESSGELWFSIEGSTAQFQAQQLVAASEFNAPFLTAISGNGTVIAGEFAPQPPPSENSEAFIWSQDLGFIGVSDLMIAAGFEMGVRNLLRVVAISEDGLRFLVDVSSGLSETSPSFSRGVLVNLQVFQGASREVALHDN